MALTIPFISSSIEPTPPRSYKDGWEPWPLSCVGSSIERARSENINPWVYVNTNGYCQLLFFFFFWKQTLTGEGAGREVLAQAGTLPEASESQREKETCLSTMGLQLQGNHSPQSPLFSPGREQQTPYPLDLMGEKYSISQCVVPKTTVPAEPHQSAIEQIDSRPSSHLGSLSLCGMCLGCVHVCLRVCGSMGRHIEL